MKHKKLKFALATSLVAVLLAFVSLTVYAYFTTRVYVYTDTGKKVAHVGMNLQLLFGKLDEVATGTDLKIPSYTMTDGGLVMYKDGVTNDPDNDQRTLFDPAAPWGSAQNPYVISETRHLQNLSALHSVGYFDLLYIANNFDEDGNYAGSASIPYFLICTSSGAPVTISGAEIEAAIEPIGSAEHPFIGVVGGAFTSGTTIVIDGDNNPETLADNKNSVASTIHHFKVQTNTKQTDVGLFGYIGYLGDESSADDSNQFAGVFSSVKNVLISDVSVVVNNPGVDEIISELFNPLWKKLFGNSTENGDVLHRFSYTGQSEASTMPHETNHIGIFAGHVSYAMVDNISIYYSDDKTYAIDLTDVAEKNYYSASGILGMMYNMNCTIVNDATLGCVVKMGTGMSSDEIGSSGSGSGTGGGNLSGNGRGYVTAAGVFSKFNNVAVKSSTNIDQVWKYKAKHDDRNWTTGILIFGELKKTEDGQEYFANYTLADGRTAANVEIVDGKYVVTATVDGVERQWENYFVRTTFVNPDGFWQIDYRSATAGTIYEYEMVGNKYNGQTMWQYSAGGDGIWHYGIRVFKNGTQYTLEDNTTPVYLTSDFKITTKSPNSNDATGNYLYWDTFFITETVDGEINYYMLDPTIADETTAEKIKRWEVDIFERKPMTLNEAYYIDPTTNEKIDLCAEWMMPTANGDVASGNYYFYDGVFTFGLSSEDDTVRDTWRNETVSTIQLGPNSVESWTIDEDRSNRALVALVTPVTSNKDLNDAILANKQFYISAIPPSSSQSTTTTTGSTAYIMSLLTDNTVKVESETKEEGYGPNRVEVTYYYNRQFPGSLNSTAVPLENNLKELLVGYYGNGTYKDPPKTPTTSIGTNGETVTREQDMQFRDENGVLRDVEVSDLGNADSYFWNQENGYTLLNIGRTSSGKTWTELKDEYNVLISNVTQGNDTKYYYYYADTGAYVGAYPKRENNQTVNAPAEVPDYIEYKEYIYYTVSYTVPDGIVNDKTNPVTDGGWTAGTTSGTLYELVRDYTFQFYYQPAPVNGKIQEPVELGSTTVKVKGYGPDGNGTSRFPTFNYGTVYYGQQEQSGAPGNNDYQDRFYTRRNFTVVEWGGERQRESTLQVISDDLKDGVEISPVMSGNGTNRTQRTKDGELIFNISYSGVIDANKGKEIPMINLTANRFHALNATLETNATAAIMSEGCASKDSGDTVPYYYYDVATNVYYKSNGDKITDLEAYKADAENKDNILLNRYPAYTLGSNTGEASRSYLQLLHQYANQNWYYGMQGDTFTIWAGTNSQYDGTTDSEGLYWRKGHTIENVLIFEENADYCYIQYTYDNETLNSKAGQQSSNAQTHHVLTRYLSYTYDENTGSFQYGLSESKEKMYVYIIEGIINTSSGVNTFVPKETESDTVELSGGSYVFWPQTTLKSSHTVTVLDSNTQTETETVMPAGEYYNSGPLAKEKTQTYKDNTYTAASLYSVDPVYTVVSLADLKWKDKDGVYLGGTEVNGKQAYGLDKKFQMADQGSFGQLNIENGSTSSVTESNMMIVPVGSNGVESVIPRGCVAFSVNATGTQTVRIIVSVPVTDLHLNESGFSSEMDLINDYYIGLWKMPALNDNMSVNFRKSSAVEKFELPRSYSFNPESTPGSLEPETTNGVENGMRHYVTVNYGGKEYRTYLNGDRFLVAYEFVIEGSDANAGTYIIGSVHGPDNQTSGESAASTDVPMEIVHFSVSGTASAGRDGVQGSQLGAIDFVYDDMMGSTNSASTIVTVDRLNINQTGGPQNEAGNENYTNYYASKCLLYSVNAQEATDVNINKAYLKVRRCLGQVADTTYYQTEMHYELGTNSVADAFKILDYADNSDKVFRPST